MGLLEVHSTLPMQGHPSLSLPLSNTFTLAITDYRLRNLYLMLDQIVGYLDTWFLHPGKKSAELVF